jgi:hypothetical protein
MTDSRAPMPPTSLASLASELDALLDEYSRQHEEYLRHAAAHREAIRCADGPAIAAAAEAQASVLESIARLEARRSALVESAARAIPLLRSGKTITLRDLARAIPSDRASILLSKAERLRALVSRAHEQASAAAGATRAMLGHIEGLMRHVARQFSHSGTYSSRGFVEPGSAVVSALDLRS